MASTESHANTDDGEGSPYHASTGHTMQETDGEQLASYEQIVMALLSHEHVFFSPETSPHQPLIRQSSRSIRFATGFRTIASLSLHPAIESALHILNADLASAHFLLRHAQVPPAWECMYLHGVLHRIEGDIDNARCWYRDVQKSELWREIWQSNDAPAEFSGKSKEQDWLNRMEHWKDQSKSHRGAQQKQQQQSSQLASDIDWRREEEELRNFSVEEIKKILKFCEQKFGVAPVADASHVWVSEEGKLKEKKQNMLVGGEGWREF